MNAAINETAKYLIKKTEGIDSGKEIGVLKIVNSETGEQDIKARQIARELYSSLRIVHPGLVVFFGKGSNPSNELYLSGTYQESEEQTVIQVTIVDEDNEVLSQYKTTYSTGQAQEKRVVLIDLEASFLGDDQLSGLNKAFHSFLSQNTPAVIESGTGEHAIKCMGDACALKIGRLLGVDQVISGVLHQSPEGEVLASAKIFDVKSGWITKREVASQTETEQTIEDVLKTLADKLYPPLEDYQIAGIDQPKDYSKPTTETVVKTKSSNILWQATAITLTVLSGMITIGEATRYNDLAAENRELEDDSRSTQSANEYYNLKEEYEHNKEDMSEARRNVTIFGTLTGVFFIWEVYLWKVNGSSEEVVSSDYDFKYGKYNLKHEFVISNNRLEPKFTVSWKW